MAVVVFRPFCVLQDVVQELEEKRKVKGKAFYEQKKYVVAIQDLNVDVVYSDVSLLRCF